MTKSDKIRTRIARHDTNLTYAQVASYLAGISTADRQTNHTHAFMLTSGTRVTVTRPHGNRDRLSTMELKAIDKALKEAGQ